MNYASFSLPPILPLSLSPFQSLRLLTRFLSLLPPPSVSRSLTLLFVFTLVPHSLLCPVIFFSVSARPGICRVEFYGSLCDVNGALDG